jgi:hypothetical protein
MIFIKRFGFFHHSKEMNNKYFSFDAETNGLRGQAFAIAAVIRDQEGNLTEWLGRCPIEGTVNQWVAENVIPEMEGIPVNYNNYSELLKGFIDFYKSNPADEYVVHMGDPVEAKLFADAYNMGIMGEFDGPYRRRDISALPEIGESVDTYNTNNGIEVPALTGGTHNPLYDSYAALFAYEHWMSVYRSRKTAI